MLVGHEGSDEGAASGRSAVGQSQISDHQPLFRATDRFNVNDAFTDWS